MPYNNITTRTEAAALIPEEVSNEVLKGLANAAAFRMFRTIPVSRAQVRIPILSALPTAYFVNGDTGLKQTTEINWANKYLNIEEIAAIVPIPENVLDDLDFDAWGEAMPLLQDAAARAADAAIFFGANKPASWPGAIVADAITAGNAVTRGTNAAATGGITGDVSDVFGAVEADGYDVNGIVASVGYKARLRNARATTGEPLLDDAKNIYGVDTMYPMRGLWPSGVGAAELIAGDFEQGIVGIRKDVTFKVLDQAVITDAAGAIIYNLPQQDMVALRMTFRLGFQVANQINYDQATEANRYPFAVLRAP